MVLGWALNMASTWADENIFDVPACKILLILLILISNKCVEIDVLKMPNHNSNKNLIFMFWTIHILLIEFSAKVTLWFIIDNILVGKFRHGLIL